MSMQRAQGVLLFLVLAVNSTQVRILHKLHALTLAARSYSLLEKQCGRASMCSLRSKHVKLQNSTTLLDLFFTTTMGGVMV